jgi:uncharacterized protein
MRPAIAETITYDRERKIGSVTVTVGSELEGGSRRTRNQELVDAAAENADIMPAFVSIDPRKAHMGAREAEALIKDGVIRGFKFRPTIPGFFPNHRMAYRLH